MAQRPFRSRFLPMRLALCSFTLLVCLTAFAQTPESPPGDATPLTINATETVFPNGLKLLVVEDHSAPVVSVQLWVHAGSKNEKPGITGISHLFEHMMFKGSKKYGPEQHATTVQSAGGTLNAYTTWDVTVYF